MDIIILYILGALINAWFICTWFFTSLPLHLFKPFMSKAASPLVESWEDWNNWLMCKNEFLAELLGCPLCLGFWSSLMVATIVGWGNDLSLGFVFAGWFSWPVLTFMIYKQLEK